mgnify:CR=1 FL=1
MRPAGGHEIDSLDSTKGHHILVAAGVPDHAYRLDRQEDRKGLTGLVVEIRTVKLFQENGVGAAQDIGIFLFHFTENTHAQTRPRERVAVDHVVGQAQFQADLAHFVLEQFTQRLDQFKGHVFRQAAHVVVRLDHVRLAGLGTSRLDHVGVDGALGEEFHILELGRLGIEHLDKGAANDLTLLFRVGDAGQAAEEQVFGAQRRVAAGGRVALEQVNSWLKVIGSTVSWTNDKEPDAGALIDEGYVWGFDAEIETPLDTIVYFDWARSRVGRETQGTQGAFALSREMAWRAGARYTNPTYDLRASIEYEEVQPEFRTVLGSAAADTRSYRATFAFPLPQNVDWTFLYQFSQDNVDDKRTNTLFLNTFSSDARYRPFDGSENAALDSLAVKCRITHRSIEDVLGHSFSTVHIVGGGIQNKLLCQLIADATGLEVQAGPVEATALGNILVQAIASGEIGSLSQARDVVRASTPVEVYTPQSPDIWEEAQDRFLRLTT